MTQINLLPWREQKREEQKKQFITVLSITILGAFFIVLLINYFISEQVRNQFIRNQMVQQEITVYERQIREINSLKILREQLIAKMYLVHKLQSTRAYMVHLFDELSQVIPSGIYLTKIEGTNDMIAASGFAKSNDHIVQVMKNIECNDWIHHPVLREIKKIEDKKEVVDNQFKLTFVLGLSTPIERIK
jgi:type IV pilus assembly protein PilN